MHLTFGRKGSPKTKNVQYKQLPYLQFPQAQAPILQCNTFELKDTFFIALNKEYESFYSRQRSSTAEISHPKT